MSQFTAIGRVPCFRGKEFYLRVENGKELEGFYRSENIDTKLSYAEGRPLIAVRGTLASRCKSGDRVALLIETRDRKNGLRGIIGISIQELRK